MDIEHHGHSVVRRRCHDRNGWTLSRAERLQRHHSHGPVARRLEGPASYVQVLVHPGLPQGCGGARVGRPDRLRRRVRTRQRRHLHAHHIQGQARDRQLDQLRRRHACQDDRHQGFLRLPRKELAHPLPFPRRGGGCHGRNGEGRWAACSLARRVHRARQSPIKGGPLERSGTARGPVHEQERRVWCRRHCAHEALPSEQSRQEDEGRASGGEEARPQRNSLSPRCQGLPWRLCQARLFHHDLRRSLLPRYRPRRPKVREVRKADVPLRVRDVLRVHLLAPPRLL
mmetsp:Transcript_4566/g.8719  ORF Transcript_4566/g.8719 Transcript_4566/m.8719 type:complete len:285 (-) Transcript_4566:240-1094(-)